MSYDLVIIEVTEVPVRIGEGDDAGACCCCTNEILRDKR